MTPLAIASKSIHIVLLVTYCVVFAAIITHARVRLNMMMLVGGTKKRGFVSLWRFARGDRARQYFPLSKMPRAPMFSGIYRYRKVLIPVSC